MLISEEGEMGRAENDIFYKQMKKKINCFAID